MNHSTEQEIAHQRLAEYTPRLEALAADHGLSWYPVDFELVPNTFMMEIAVYGLPVRMPHWSFGVRYIYQYVQHRMGNSKIFEVVFPGNPNLAYLVKHNSLAENTLVTAHVLGHADFSKNNSLFVRMQQQVGYHMVEQAAERARRIQDAIDEHGQAQVERVLDAALALEQCVDLARDLHRRDAPEPETRTKESGGDPFAQRFKRLPGEHRAGDEQQAVSGERPETAPESDLLWFMAHNAPEMKPWERDIFLAVREETFYFYPVFACQIMNEGWASYWHARLLREADFLPDDLYVEAIKVHSDVVRPYAGDKSVALQLNPYHLGFCMWEKIIEEAGLETALSIRAEEDDFSFIRNWLDEDLARELKLFRFTEHRDPIGNAAYRVEERDIEKLRESIIAPKFNFGAPRVYVKDMAVDGTLVLAQNYEVDGRGLDIHRAQKVLEYIHDVWRRPVSLLTIDAQGAEKTLTIGSC